jgi:methylated-DNA-protein-cysteine methyltransferase-like protein
MVKRSGPSNYERIWETVRHIPRGKVASYGEIAQQSGLPGQPRLVGYALHNLPDGMDIPWHRVINARGMISLRKKTRGHARQRKLLEQEGLVFRNDRIDFATFGWLQSLKSPYRRTSR